jgi:hypothetical protein
MIDPFEEYEAERLKALALELAEEDARNSTPAGLAKISKRKNEEHAKGVRLGWWDEEGNEIAAEEIEDEDEDED